MTSRREFLVWAGAAGAAGTLGWLGIAHPADAERAIDGEATVAGGGVVQTVLGPIDASKPGFTLPQRPRQTRVHARHRPRDVGE